MLKASSTYCFSVMLLTVYASTCGKPGGKVYRVLSFVSSDFHQNAIISLNENI
ncbi:hypothetical protein PF005_g23428 [Phytophthora fragariae]|uniref:RxLR effector protein n=2 Tax=Phytophthora TaxID=4783 RepID=A0A6A3WCS5_9STRA|nr:hypothetical protein PF009_g24392 [Phytophthora fragariae]KAE8982201.1 hypothetical protein PR002_g23595 [Phytophthora rubi]KAE8981411.1 hypothetical protein PF011_g22035 [Phytophthora fragariae]KAE8983639.1 hypothetical protein PR001_g23395 [Phytophthora rubi]KAE9079856.1 hypothetical protein PF010_g22601 [Phytophthora fragariae]